MERLDTEKLYVEFKHGVTYTQPIESRRYTLTHSDITGDLFLTVGLEYSYDKINKMRDEVLGEWRNYNGYPFLYLYVYVNGQFEESISAIRDAIFRRELPLVIEAIRYGDSKLFIEHPELDNGQILVYFDSVNKEYNKFENWGTLKDYK